MKDWGIIYCPNKGLFSYRKYWDKVAEVINDYNIGYELITAETSKGIKHAFNTFINKNYHTIVIVGGDSALNEAVNELMQIDPETREQIKIGIIPNGTMNDFALFWNIKEDDIKKSILTIKKGRVKKIDLGVIRYTNYKNETRKRYFLDCINVGLVATIANLRYITKRLLGSRTLSFVVSFILLIFQRMDYRMKIKVNNELIERYIMTVCIGNTTGYGQTPNAVPYNGMLDMSIVYQPKSLQLLEGIYLFMRGKLLNYRSVHPYRTTNIDFYNTKRVLVSIDGRVLKNKFDNFSIRVEAEAINFIIP